MNTADTLLPPGFEALQAYATPWAMAGAQARLQRRLHSSEAERDAFYAALQPRLADALALLDAKSPTQFDAREQRLLQMLPSLAHVALAIERQGSDESAHARARQCLTITRASAGA